MSLNNSKTSAGATEKSISKCDLYSFFANSSASVTSLNYELSEGRTKKRLFVFFSFLTYFSLNKMSIIASNK